MKAAEINAIFSAKINEYLSAGYQINTNTMNGSQGEIAKIDFRKGDEVIRVLLRNETIWGDDFSTADAIILMVGRCTDERVISTQGFERDAIIWNERLEVIEKRTFFRFGYSRHCDWYLEGQEAQDALDLNSRRRAARYKIKWEEETRTRGTDITSDALRKILIPAVRRHLGKPKMKAERIDTITRRWDSDNHRIEYIVRTIGRNTVSLH